MSTFFAEIVVDSYQDPARQLFTYRIPENMAGSLKEGSRVTVPFGKRVVEGSVWGISDRRPPFPTKDILEIKGLGFGKTQIELAKWMVKHYLASPRECLSCQTGEKGSKTATAAPDKITTLVLVPYASQVKLRALAEKQNNALIGSRSAVFAQLPHLKRIIIEEPENWNYKDERTPYYHAAEVAQKRAELENLEIELHYQTPRVEDVKMGVKISPVKPVKVVDLGREKLAGNFTFVSAPMETALSSGKYSLVYVNSRELREGVSEELRKINLDKNLYKVVGPELFALPGQEYFHTIWADVDTLLNLPDFRAHEKIVWTVQNLNKITRGKLFLQTSSPENPLFKELVGGRLDSFYQRELENREELSFPPFSTLIKLSYSAKSSTKVYQEAEGLNEKIQGIEYKVSSPYEPYAKTPGKVQLNLVVKIKLGDLAGLAKLAKVIPPDWKVEVDPESLL